MPPQQSKSSRRSSRVTTQLDLNKTTTSICIVENIIMTAITTTTTTETGRRQSIKNLDASTSLKLASSISKVSTTRRRGSNASSTSGEIQICVKFG